MNVLLRKLRFTLMYFRKPPWDTGISPPELMDFIHNHPPGRALDLGCGTGTNVLTLAQHGWQTTGVDYISQPVRAARKKIRQAGVQAEVRVEDVTQLRSLHGPYDLILDIGCYHGLSPEGKAACLERVVSLLAPGGAYLMYAFVKQTSAPASGLLPADLELLESRLVLTQRVDGSERRSESDLRSSAWFTFHKPPAPGS